MERERKSEPARMRAVRGIRAWLLSGASMAVLLGAGPALAQVPADERVYRAEALAHAGAVEAAWRRLETFILKESSAAASWPGAVPPAATGWQASWTRRGLEARYCEDTLLVYLAPDELKGTGADHRTVHAAPHAYGGGEKPVLHWLESGVAQGGEGRASVTLPACLSEAAQGGPLPSGRAALAGAVRDPFLHTTERVTRERKEEPCPAGTHGEGRTLVREVTRTENGRGDPVGDPVEGIWEVLIDLCREDYSRWEHYTLTCHWDAGAPHNRRMEGREVWRRLRTVTGAGETLGEPEFVSTSCWTGAALPPAPVPEISENAREEMMSGSCPAGYAGSIGYRRTVTLRSTRFPWDEAPVTQTITGPWTVASDGCMAVPEPEHDRPDHGDPDEPDQGDSDEPDQGDSDEADHGDSDEPDHGSSDGPDYGDPDSPDGGAGAPGGDSCDGTDSDGSDPGGDTCSTDGLGGLGGGDGGGDDGGDGDACFLTTAVVELRGEADGGPTLTALRAFRDGYMTRTAERRALVEEYYGIAPRIVAAIPAGHRDWAWIGARVDDAVASIDAGDEDGAFGIYVAMVSRLKAEWLGGGGLS